MSNQIEENIKKIEESLSSSNYQYSTEEVSMLNKIVKLIWILLGTILLAVSIVTVTGWLTMKSSIPSNLNETFNVN